MVSLGQMDHLPKSYETTATEYGIAPEQLAAAPEWANFLVRDQRHWHWLSHHPRYYTANEIATGALPMDYPDEQHASANRGEFPIGGRGDMCYIVLAKVGKLFKTRPTEQLLTQAAKLKAKRDTLAQKDAALKKELDIIDLELRYRGLKRI